MSLRPTFRRLGLALGALLLTAAVGCGGKNDSAAPAETAFTLSGKVTFDRIPLVRNPAGVPTGLETDPAKFELNKPARGIRVVLYKKLEIKDLAGVTQTFYQFADAQGTAVDGAYSFSVPAGGEWMVEVQGTVLIGTTPSQTINLVADPAGLASTVPALNRLHYCLRKAPDGTLPPSTPGANLVATSAVTANTSGVDFHIGLNSAWYLSDTSVDRSGSLGISQFVRAYSPGVGAAGGYAQAGTLETTPTGSRIPAILDALYEFGTFGGITALPVTPDGAGSILDLHYRLGASDPKGTHMAWDRTQYPEALAWDPVTMSYLPTGVNVSFDPQAAIYRYFGSIRGDEATNSDAWDPAQIQLLAARSWFFNQINTYGWYRQRWFESPNRLLPLDTATLDADPQLALMEGFPEAAVAVLQKNPYLADTTAGATTYTDVRDLSGVPAASRKITCAAFLPALTWEIALKASALPSPGTATDWANLKSAALLYYFTLGVPSETPDTPTLYQQFKVLQTATSSTTVPDVSAIFTDAAIQDLLANTLGVPPGNIPWPRPTTGSQSTFVTNWGDSPNSGTTPLPPFALSMANATQVGGFYPNTSSGEVHWAQFTLTQNKIYDLSVTLTDGTSPLTLTNGSVEVTFLGLATPDGQTQDTFTLSASTGTPIRFTPKASNGISTLYRVRVRMLSPAALQPDTTVGIALVPAS